MLNTVFFFTFALAGSGFGHCLATGDLFASRSIDWYFWTKTCEVEFTNASIEFQMCFKKVHARNSFGECEKFSKNLESCYGTMLKFECPSLDVQSVIRETARDEVSILKDVYCKLNFSQVSWCLSKIYKHAHTDCRMASDMGVPEICSTVDSTNDCFSELIAQKCNEDDRNETLRYFDLLTKQLICGCSTTGPRAIILLTIFGFWFLFNGHFDII